MIVDDPATRAEVEAAVADYERALMANDLDTLDALFWQSPSTVRYGPGQNLHGIAEIRAFRAGRPGGSPRRTVLKVAITTFGADFATANVEFQREGAARSGRQSQTWVRLPEGWRVVAAHVSMLADGH
ncbi:MAG TPA: oxalurate catabolism protein HpxZ [Sphingomonas sp.]